MFHSWIDFHPLVKNLQPIGSKLSRFHVFHHDDFTSPARYNRITVS